VAPAPPQFQIPEIFLRNAVCAACKSPILYSPCIVAVRGNNHSGQIFKLYPGPRLPRDRLRRVKQLRFPRRIQSKCPTQLPLANLRAARYTKDTRTVRRKGQNQTFDALETKYLLTDYSFSLFESAYKQVTKQRIERPKDCLSFGLLNHEEKLTFAGALLADISPVYQSCVFCTRWNGLDKTSGLVL
jgi:hypothetical protein